MVMGIRGLFDVSVGTDKCRSDAGAMNFYRFIFNMLADSRELNAISRTDGGLRVNILVCH